VQAVAFTIARISKLSNLIVDLEDCSKVTSTGVSFLAVALKKIPDLTVLILTLDGCAKVK